MIAKNILRHMMMYASSQYAAQLMGFFTALFMRRYLGPYAMGIWATLQLIISYVSYVHLGGTTALYYKIPILNGRGERDEALLLQRTMFTYLFVTVSLAAAGIIFYALFFADRSHQVFFIGLLCTSVILIFQRLFAFQVLTLRTHKDFGILSRVVALEAALNLLLVFVVVRQFHIYGLYFASIFLPVVFFFYINQKKKTPLEFGWNTKRFVECLKFGFPTFVRDYLNQILNTIDRFMIVRLMGFHALGVFSVATMARNYSESLYKNFGAVLSPYLLEEFGRTTEPKQMSRYIQKPTLIFSHLMACLLGAAYFVSGPFISMVLPQFDEGILTLRVYLVAVFFSVISAQCSVYLTALGKQMNLIVASATAIVLNIVLNFYFFSKDAGIAGVAGATSIVSALYFLFLCVYAVRQFESWRGTLIFLAEVLFPFVWAASLIAVLLAVWVQDSWAPAIFKTLVFWMAFIPLIWRLNIRTKIVSLVFEMFSKWRSQDKEGSVS